MPEDETDCCEPRSPQALLGPTHFYDPEIAFQAALWVCSVFFPGFVGFSWLRLRVIPQPPPIIPPQPRIMTKMATAAIAIHAIVPQFIVFSPFSLDAGARWPAVCIAY